MKTYPNKFNFSVLLLSMCAVQAVEKNEEIIQFPEEMGAQESRQDPNDSINILLDWTDNQRQVYAQRLSELECEPAPYDPDMETTIVMPATDPSLEQDAPPHR